MQGKGVWDVEGYTNDEEGKDAIFGWKVYPQQLRTSS
jgi:hypothetical protein